MGLIITKTDNKTTIKNGSKNKIFTGPCSIDDNGTYVTVTSQGQTAQFKKSDVVSIGGQAPAGDADAWATQLAANFPDASGDSGGASSFAALTGDPNDNDDLKKQILPATVIYLSQHGCVSDSDIEGGVAGTNCSPAIQAVADLAATLDSLIIIVDGQYCFEDTVRLHDNTKVRALHGCGGIHRDAGGKGPGTYPHGFFENYDFETAFNTPSSGLVNKNISIEGGIWNQLPHAVEPYDGIPFHFCGVDGLSVTNTRIIGHGFWAIKGFQCDHVTITHNRVEGGNSGGIQFNAKCHHLNISYNYIKAEDDHIAFNADDIYEVVAPMYWPQNPDSVAGEMIHINCVGNYFDNGLFSGIRILSSISRVEDVYIGRQYGVCNGYGLVIDKYWQDPTLVPDAGAGNVGAVTIDGWHVTGINPTGLSYIENGGILIRTKFEHIKLLNAEVTDMYPGVTFLEIGKYARGRKLTVSGLRAVDTSSDARALIKIVQGWSGGALPASVDLLVLNDISYDKADALFTESPIVQIEGDSATVRALRMNNIESINCGPIVDHISGTLGRVSAYGVTHVTEGTEGFLRTAGTVPILTLSNFDGPVTHTGTVTVTNGDAFTNDPIPDFDMGPRLFDDFNRPDSTTSIGNLVKPNIPWEVVLGTFGIGGNKGYAVSEINSGPIESHHIKVDAGKANYTASIRFDVVGTGNASFMPRYVDANNRLHLEVNTTSTTLYKRVGGAYIQLGVQHVATNGSELFTVVLDGDDITVKKNGADIITATDSAFNTATEIGIGVISGAGYGGGVAWDDFTLQ